MKRIAALAVMSLVCTAAFAAAPKFNIKNNSPETLVSEAVSNEIWMANLSDKINKLHPAKAWGYISEVSGGFDGKTCIVTARAMMVPAKGKAFTYAPKHTTATFGMQANASQEQCSALAKAKLTEAVKSLTSTLESQ